MKSIVFASAIAAATAQYGFEQGTQCQGMGDEANEIDKSFGIFMQGPDKAAQDCAEWCEEKYLEMNTGLPNCCWYGKFKASGMGAKACYLGTETSTEPMSEQLVLD